MSVSGSSAAASAGVSNRLWVWVSTGAPLRPAHAAFRGALHPVGARRPSRQVPPLCRVGGLWARDRPDHKPRYSGCPRRWEERRRGGGCRSAEHLPDDRAVTRAATMGRSSPAPATYSSRARRPTRSSSRASRRRSGSTPPWRCSPRSSCWRRSAASRPQHANASARAVRQERSRSGPGTYEDGSVTVNREPTPGRLSTSMRPPWARTSSATIASPMPAPPVALAREGSPRQNRSKM